MRHFLSLACLILLLSLPSFGQKDIYYRIRADFSIKEKSTEGKSSLTMGQVYFDKLKHKLLYNILFPEKEVWLFKDTIMYKIKAGSVDKKPLLPGFIDFSIFNLALNNNLKDYGLKKTMFSLSGVVKEDNMVISTWVPKKEYSKVLGEVKISIMNNRLNGVIFYGPEKNIIGKQLFSNYITIKGFEFPTEILHLAYLTNGQEIHQLTTFKNIKINDWDEASFYDYPVPR
jgi:hypothetical protein